MRVRSRTLKVLCVFAAFLPCVTTATSQSSSSNSNVASSSRDPQGLQIVESSLQALGGRDRIALIKDGTARVIMLDSSSSAVLGECIWRNRFPRHFEYRCPHHTVRSQGVKGTPERERQGARSVAVSPQVLVTDFPPYFVALLLRQQLDDRRTNVLSADPLYADGKTLLHVRLVSYGSSTLQAITRREWFFDPDTKLPVRVEVPATTGSAVSSIIRHIVELREYKSVQGVQIPFLITTSSLDGSAETLAQLAEVQLNTGIKDEDLRGEQH